MNLFLKQCAAECVGTFFLVFVGCGAVITVQLHPEISSMIIPIAFGGVVSVMVYAVGHISGAHFNPAVSIAFAVTRHFPLKCVSGYVTAQCLGALFASALLALFWRGQPQNLGVTTFAIPTLFAFGFEMAISFLLMFVIISVATDTRAKGEMAGLAIGTAVGICSAFAGPITGASMNPARSLGPALVSGELHSLWLYILAPILGAALGAKTYEKIR